MTTLLLTPTFGRCFTSWSVGGLDKERGTRGVGHGRITREALAPVVALVIAVVWTASFIVDIFVTAYEAPASVHGAFMLSIGYLFGREFIGGKG